MTSNVKDLKRVSDGKTLINRPRMARELSPDEFGIARQKCTEPVRQENIGTARRHPGVSLLRCSALFSSQTKYGQSGCCRRKLYKPINNAAIDENQDNSHGMVRTEALCHQCDAHLGHILKMDHKPDWITPLLYDQLH